MFGFILLSSLQYFISLERHGHMESSVLLSLSASYYKCFWMLRNDHH